MDVIVGVGIYFIIVGLLFETSTNLQSLLYKIVPFLSGVYILLSTFNKVDIYIPYVFGGIGLYFVCFGLIVSSRDWLIRYVYTKLPLVIGVLLILKCLRDINLI